MQKNNVCMRCKALSKLEWDKSIHTWKTIDFQGFTSNLDLLNFMKISETM